ncbi:MAG TPA: cytochrome P450 [Ktedonobacteraceae bacterium]|nr:cytochrome P450 [Ktedonobacteraceae bacterium]
MPNKASLPPGPKGLPIVGNIFQLRRDPLSFVRETQKTYGRMATVHFGKQQVVLFFHPEHVRYFLVEKPRNFVKYDLGNLRFLLGDGLLTSDGDFHRQQRRLVQPAFHKHRVEGYAETMVHLTEEMLEQWRPGSEIDMSREMQQLTLRIILKALFNLDSPTQSASLGRAITTVITNSIRNFGSVRGFRLDLPFTGYGRMMAAKRELDIFVYDLIKQRRADGRDVGDVLSMLLQAQDEGNTMNDKQIHDQVFTLIAAGHETARNTMSWTFYLLSQHPHVLEKLLAELHTVLQGRSPDAGDLPNLPYLEWVINESWRVYPPAFALIRRAVDAFDLDGYRFPAGTIAVFSQWVLHHLPDIWGDPDVFRPERWDPINGQQVPQWAYFPFGGGPFMCIGMPFAELETRLLLATILQHYTPRLVPGFKVVPQPRVTLCPKYGMHMILETTPAEVPTQIR